MSPENVSRTFIGSVVCVDLVGYSTKSVAKQISIKETFTRLLANALQRVPEEERIILDTGDGAAVSFLGDPEQGLALGLAMREASAAHATELGAARGAGAVRIGINLGPMKVALDLNGYPRIVGDGINVAEKIAAFAQPGEIVVAHSFHDMVSRLSDANARLFRAAGTATDKNGREHQIYMVDKPGARASRPARAPEATAAPAAPTASAQGAPEPQAVVPAARGGAFAGFLRDRLKVGFAATLLVALSAAEAVMLVLEPSPAPVPVAAAPVTAPPPAPVRVEPAAPKPVPASERAAPPKVTEPEAKKLPEPVAPKPAPPTVKAPEPPPKAPDAAPKAPEAAPKAPPAQAAAKLESRPEPRPREPAKPAKREETAKAVIAPQPAPPPPIVPPPEPREEPKPAPPPPSPVATPIVRAAVNFPPAAAARNIDAGSVKARRKIDAAGRGEDVQILESRPRRYFDEEAARSLREWRFNPGADNRSYDVEIAFQR